MRPTNIDCARHGDLLERLVDGDLTAAERQRLDAHLAACEDCRREAELAERLAAATAALPRRIEPPRDLWPSVASRLEPRRRSSLGGLAAAAETRWAGPALAALAAVLALAVGLSLWRPGAAPGHRMVVVARTPTPSLAAQAEVARSEDRVQLVHSDLLASLERRRQQLPPESLAAIEENMRILDEAIGQIRSALEDDPLDRRLSVMLAARYQREVELLRRVNGV